MNKDFKTLKELYEFLEQYIENGSTLSAFHTLCKRIILGQLEYAVSIFDGYLWCLQTLLPYDVLLYISYSLFSNSSELRKYIRAGKPAPEDVEFFGADITAPDSETAEQN